MGLILVTIAILASLATATGLTVYVVKAMGSYRIDPPRTAEAPLEDHMRVAINDRIDALTLAVDEGIRRVDRAEKRIQKTVTSARRLVREAGLEHAGIEAEYAELQPPNDVPVDPLQAMLPYVEEPRTVRIPGGELIT